MSQTGVIFDIKEFAVYDGPGIRTTVFFKGCPLRCMWCHNPEGLSFKPQLMVSHAACTHCGRCVKACPHTDVPCQVCGACVRSCPQRLRKVCGDTWTAQDLAEKLLRDADGLPSYGGVTVSGGEPTGQPAFLLELLERLSPLHRAMETSGFCAETVFQDALARLDYVLLDIKLADSARHKYYTGVDNAPILRNLALLKDSGKPFRVRIPVIPGVNDDDDNLEQTAKLLEGASNLELVELLPYHVTAGAKYEMVGLKYAPEFDGAAKPRLNTAIFEAHGLTAKHL